jgi:hypothetical protein
MVVVNIFEHVHSLDDAHKVVGPLNGETLTTPLIPFRLAPSRGGLPDVVEG